MSERSKRDCNLLIQNFSRKNKLEALSTLTSMTLVHSFIIALLDFSNAVFAGLIKAIIRQLRLVVNFAARFLANPPKFLHVRNYMPETLHCLQVEDRIAFKILLLGRASMVVSAPEYIRELCYCDSHYPVLHSIVSSKLLLDSFTLCSCIEPGWSTKSKLCSGWGPVASALPHSLENILSLSQDAPL